MGHTKRKYKICGSISTDRKIKNAIDQSSKYSTDSGSRFAVVSNGSQFIIFESFRPLGKWNEGYCTIFKSLEDISTNYTYFCNILCKESVLSGSLGKYFSEQSIPLEFTRPLDYVHNKDADAGKNALAPHLSPIIKAFFIDLTDESQIEALNECYVGQRQLNYTNDIIKQDFDRLPHYAKQFGIDWFKETSTTAGEFQISFEKCKEFLSTKTPIGSTIILLGGIGAGKTTFIHHFFKIVLGNREDVLWFNVDFGKSPPDMESIETFIYENIIDQYNKKYKIKLYDILVKSGIESPKSQKDSILTLFTILRYYNLTISIVLDNVDQHSYTSPKFQERVFEIAQNLTHEFKTITILTLREESFFRSTKSGVLDAYHIPMYHIESPNFEELIRNRIDYVIKLLNNDKEKIIKITQSPSTDWNTVKSFFEAIKYSIRETRSQGRGILRFINDISG